MKNESIPYETSILANDILLNVIYEIDFGRFVTVNYILDQMMEAGISYYDAVKFLHYAIPIFEKERIIHYYFHHKLAEFVISLTFKGMWINHCKASK
jgi:hypothetical protein